MNKIQLIRQAARMTHFKKIQTPEHGMSWLYYAPLSGSFAKPLGAKQTLEKSVAGLASFFQFSPQQQNFFGRGALLLFPLSIKLCSQTSSMSKNVRGEKRKNTPPKPKQAKERQVSSLSDDPGRLQEISGGFHLRKA